MICKDLAEYAAKIIASSPLYLEVRQVYVVDSTFVNDLVKQPFNMLKQVKAGVTTALELILEEDVNISFDENTFFYVVYYNPTFDLVIIPEWFQQVMVGTKSQTFSIKCSNMKGEQVIQTPEILKLSKFNILIED